MKRIFKEIQPYLNLKNQVKLIKNYLNSRKITSIALISKLVGLVLAGALLGLNSPVKASETNKTVLVLNTNSVNQMVSVSVNSVSKITVTESKAQEKARLEREAKSKARIAKTKSVLSTTVTTITGSIDVSLEQKRALVQKAASQYGIDWKILEAVWQIETGKRWVTSVRSYAGAQGPMQFMPGTWRGYAVDGNGDGVANVYHAEDAVPAAARLLAANGGAENIDRALFAYNHANWYVEKVKKIAASI